MCACVCCACYNCYSKKFFFPCCEEQTNALLKCACVCCARAGVGCVCIYFFLFSFGGPNSQNSGTGLQKRNGKEKRTREKQNKTKHTHKIIVAKNVRREREDERDTTHTPHLKRDGWGVEKIGTVNQLRNFWTVPGELQVWFWFCVCRGAIFFFVSFYGERKKTLTKKNPLALFNLGIEDNGMGKGKNKKKNIRFIIFFFKQKKTKRKEFFLFFFFRHVGVRDFVHHLFSFFFFFFVPLVDKKSLGKPKNKKRAIFVFWGEEGREGERSVEGGARVVVVDLGFSRRSLIFFFWFEFKSMCFRCVCAWDKIWSRDGFFFSAYLKKKILCNLFFSNHSWLQVTK